MSASKIDQKLNQEVFKDSPMKFLESNSIEGSNNPLSPNPFDPDAIKGHIMSEIN